MNSEATLTSLAMLKLNIDQGKDYLEYLRPFILRILKNGQLDTINDTNIAQKLKEENGLEIPKRTVHVILQRLSKGGLLKKHDGTYQIVKEIEVIDWQAENADATRKISSVVHFLIEFAKETSGKELNEDEAMDCLVNFLSKFSIPCMKTYLRGTALPQVNGNEHWKIVLVSQYVQTIIKTNPERFENFMVIVQGHMLANALLCPDLQSTSSAYKEVKFYLDTPLLVQLLGLEGEEKKQASSDLISLVQRLDGNISYFTHTREELINVITGAADFIDSAKGRGAIVYEARRAKLTRSDLLLIAQKAVENLETLNIFHQQTPAYIPTFQIDETAFSHALSDEVNYYNPRARDYDINSVRSIYALRKGSCPISIEKSKAVFVTNNSGFAKAAFDYGRNIEQSREVSTVITDFSLANTAWLKAPQGAPSLPRKEVLAFSYAALRPTGEFWEKFLQESEKLEKSGRISARDHQILRSSQHVQEELMKLTLGEDAALTEETITGALTRVVAEIKKEESQKIDKIEKERADVELKLRAVLAKNDDIKEKIYWRCDKSAKDQAIFLTATIWAAQAAVALTGIISLIATKSQFALVLIAIAIISGFLRLAGSIWDIKPLKVYASFRAWRRQQMVLKEYRSLGIEEG